MSSASSSKWIVTTVPGRDLVGLRRLADLGGAQQLLQVADARLLLALLLAGGVVAAVLPEVALLAAGVDLGGDDRAVGDQLVELGLQPVVRVLGQPGGGAPRSGVDTDDLLVCRGDVDRRANSVEPTKLTSAARTAALPWFRR